MAAITSSPPSSPPHSSFSSFGTTAERVARSLVANYAKNEHPLDRTSKILFAFLDHLALDGVQAIVDDIVDSSDLHALAEHYFSAILLPSMFHNLQSLHTINALWPLDAFPLVFLSFVD
jgi:hypothetical protein